MVAELSARRLKDRRRPFRQQMKIASFFLSKNNNIKFYFKCALLRLFPKNRQS